MNGLAEVCNFLVARDDANGGHVAFCLDCDFECQSLMLHGLARIMATHYRSHYESEQAGQP